MSPDAALAEFTSHVVLTQAELATLGEQAWTVAWTVARAATVEVASAVRDSLAAALQEGLTFAEWRKTVPDVWETTKAHMATTFRTTLGSAYEAQRAGDLLYSDVVEYLVFSAINDDRTTEQCRSLDGKAWPRAQFPPAYWPPCWFNCRSTVYPEDRAGMQRYPGDALQQGPVQGYTPREGFDGPPTFSGLLTASQRSLQEGLARLDSPYVHQVPGVPPMPSDHPLASPPQARR
jgi:SPP1 gp7 family putative phage head morphogenesis protein